MANRYKNEQFDLTTTNATDIYTCPSESRAIIQIIKPEKIIEKITNLKTGEEYKDDNEWKSKGVPETDIRRDIKVLMPSLDIFGKTK